MTERFELFTVLITKINRNIKKIKNREMAEYGLRSIHVSCLYYLYSAKGLTATDLCERCEEDKASISRALEYLEQTGFVAVQSQTVKRYKAPLSLTEQGEKVGKEIFDKVQRVLDEVGAALSEEERSVFYRSLSAISERLETVTSSME